MKIKRTIYNKLPGPVKPFIKRGYHRVVNPSVDEDLHSEFVNHFYDSRREYNRFINEIEDSQAVELRDKALQEFQKLTGTGNLYGVGTEMGKEYYAITRKLNPNTVVETGVCNGVSTLFILLALHENEKGTLYSIDYPLKVDESLEKFRNETFEQYGGAAIPSDKQPGWIIPDKLRSRWELTIGKTQRELPRLVTELEEFDIFLHDSEHSHPCMMFEYELAYEWLRNRGIIISDDITWNDAFSIFNRVREPKYGKLSQNVGYIQKVSRNEKVG